MKTKFKIFMIFCVISCSFSEKLTEKFYLVTNNEDNYGYISNIEFKDVAGIHSFKRNDHNFYNFEEIIQKFNVKSKNYHPICIDTFNNIVVVSDIDNISENDNWDFCSQKIINMKNPERFILLDVSKYLSKFSFIKNNFDLILIHESIIIEKEEDNKILSIDEIDVQLKKRKLKYYQLDSITGKKKIIDKDVWGKNFENFYPLCYVRENYVNMRDFWNDEQLFPINNNEFLKKIEKSENGEQLLKLFSIGSNKYYFISAYTKKSSIYYYDTDIKVWNSFALDGNINSTIGYGDYLAIEHIYPELMPSRKSNGCWTFFKNSEVIDNIYLGIPSKVLAFDGNGIIFSNDCRLYSAKISRKGLYDVKKIAEHNLIRFAEKLYFPKKENLESEIDK